jgi:hydroxymethylpyrimidine pyrophosphatase-like HAD family hydrolase
MLHAAGLLVVLASSRSGRLCLGLAHQLGISAPIIAGDGSVLVDPLRSEAIRTELLGVDRIAGIAMAIRTAETGAVVVIERGIHAATDHSSELPVGLRELVTIDEQVESSALFSRPATRMFLQAPQRRLERALAVIRETWWRERVIAIHEHAPGVVAITATSADRGVALQRVESAMGMERRSSLVVAATTRDLGMLEFAGVGLSHPGLPASHHGSADRVLETDDLLEIGQALIRADLASTVRAATPRG